MTRRFSDNFLENWPIYAIVAGFIGFVGLIIAFIVLQPTEGYVLSKDYTPEHYQPQSYYDPNTKTTSTTMQYYGPTWALWLCKQPAGTLDNDCGWRYVSSGDYERAQQGQWWSVNR